MLKRLYVDNYRRLENFHLEFQELTLVVAELVEMCRAGKLRQPAPTSLEAACDEYHTRLEGEPR